MTANGGKGRQQGKIGDTRSGGLRRAEGWEDQEQVVEHWYSPLDESLGRAGEDAKEAGGGGETGYDQVYICCGAVVGKGQP